MSAQPAEIDPFADAEKAPALSFKDAPVGTVHTGTVTGAPKTVQSRDYKTGEPAFWPAKQGETPNPKMAVVINIEINGEPFSVWAGKPSAMFAAIGEAQRAAGSLIAVGGTLAIKLTGEKPAADPKNHPQKLYAARYTPPAPVDTFARDDGFGAAVAAGAVQPGVSATPAAPWDDQPPF